MSGRGRLARGLALAGLAALVLAAVADHADPFALATTSFAALVTLLLAARPVVVDGWPDVELAAGRVVLALLALAVGWRPGPLGFHDTGHAVAVGLRAAALVLSLGALGKSLSPETLARLARLARERRIDRFVIAAAVVLGAALVLRELHATASEPLAPDAQVFRGIALRPPEHPYDTGFREPLHVWVLWALGRLTGASDLSMRLLTVFLYMTSAVVFYAVTRSFFGRGFAALALLAYALSAWNARMSVMGLRTEEVTLAVLLTVYLGRRAVAPGARPRDVLLAGLASGLAALTYLSLLATTQVWLLGSFLLARAPLRRYSLALLPALALVVPHLVYEAQKTGDPLYTLDMHAVFYRNVELAGRPGYPTKEEVARDAYAGPRTTALRWMFLDRAPSEAATILARGAARLATFRSPPFDAYRPQELGFVVWLAAGLGLLAIVLRARDRLWIPLLVVLGSGPVVFPLGTFVAMEPRLVNQFFFAWLWLAGGLWAVSVPGAAPSLEGR